MKIVWGRMWYTLLMLVVLLMLIVLLFLNSTKTIQWAADTYAAQYGFGYKKISGGFLTGLEVEALTFKKEPVVDTLKLGWNPAALLYNKISISHLNVKGLNVDTVQKVVEAFSFTEEESDSPFLMHLSVSVGQVNLTVKPFEVSGIGVRAISLNGKGIFYYGEDININNIALSIDTNVSRIELNGGRVEKSIRIKKLSIVDVDTIALQDVIERMIALNIDEVIVEKVEPEIKQYKSGQDNFIPKNIRVDSAVLRVKSAAYPQIRLNRGEVKVSNLEVDIYGMIDLKPNTIQLAKFSLLLDSNLTTIVQNGVIKDNQLKSQGHITQINKLFESYGLPLKKDAFGKIPLKIHADVKQVMIDIDIKGKDILQSKEGEFNVEHLSLKNNITYLIPEAKLTVKTEGNISIPYAKDIHLENVLTFEDGVLVYKGKIDPGTLQGVDANHTKPLNDLKITYKGDDKSIEALIDSEGIEGKFVSLDLKKADLTLSTKKPLVLKNMLSLPNELQSSKVAVDIHVPLDFANITPLNASAKVTSNVANIDANIFYDNALKITTKTIFPKDSLLRNLSKELNFDALSPLQADISMKEKIVIVEVESNGLTSNVHFDTETKDLEGDLVLGGTNFIFDGNVEKKVSLMHTTTSLKNLLKQVKTIYNFEAPPIDGDIKLAVVLTDMNTLEFNLNSNTLRYQADKKTEYILNNTMISLGFEDASLTLNKYHTMFQEQKIFATKPSLIHFNEGNIEIASFWINDELSVAGRYNIENNKGEILAYANPLTLSHEMTDMSTHIELKSSMEGNRTTIKGSIKILGGNVYYDMDKKTFASDKDIIIVQEMEKEKPTPFMDNLVASIKVNTVNPLLYKTDEADIKIKTDLWVKKEALGPLSVVGEIEILKGSSYTIENKKFVFKKSTITFTGDPKEPILNIATGYNSVKAEINIQIAGSLAAPDIVFSSIPYMSKQEILTSILFGSSEDSADYSEEEKLKMLDGKIVKSILSNAGEGVVNTVFSTLGINIDALPFIGKSNDINKTKKAFFAFFSKEDESGIPSHEIAFSGQEHHKEAKLQKIMGVDTKNIFQFWKEDRPTIKDKLLPTLEESLRDFYISEGFYDAKFSIKKSKTKVTVKIDENKPIRIREVKINSDYDIADMITYKDNAIFKAKEFSAMKRNITEKLLQDGYCSYELDSKAYIDILKHEANINIIVKKGAVCTFGKVTVKGLNTIDDAVVLSRVRAREGERFSIERIKESYDALYGLGAFDSVSIKHDRKSSNVVPVEIEGREISKPWYFKGGLSFDTNIGLGISVDAVQTNFMGNAKQIGMHLEYSDIVRLAEVSYFVPAEFNLLGYYMDITSKVGYRQFIYTGFEEDKSYAEVTLGYNDEKLSLHAGLALENIDISSSGSSSVTNPFSSENFLLASPFFEFSYDTRDSKLDPKFGYYIAGKIEYALPYNSDASSYLKYDLEGRAIYTFSSLTLAAVGKAGSVDQLQNEVPASKFFYAGGIDSNRAYGYKRVGVILSPTSYGPLGGATMANLTLEANYPLWESLYGAVFTDNTILTNESYDFTGDILTSAGVGLRYITPIGPLKVDVGMNVADPSQYAVWFLIGQSF